MFCQSDCMLSIYNHIFAALVSFCVVSSAHRAWTTFGIFYAMYAFHFEPSYWSFGLNSFKQISMHERFTELSEKPTTFYLHKKQTCEVVHNNIKRLRLIDMMIGFNYLLSSWRHEYAWTTPK